MRIVSLASAVGLAALALGPQTAIAQDRRGVDPELAREIRRIVREEVRAALRELHRADAAEQKPDQARAQPRRVEVKAIDLPPEKDSPEGVRTIVRRLGGDAPARPARIQIPEMTDRVDVEHVRRMLEESLEPKLRDAEHRIQVLVKRLDAETEDLDVEIGRAVEKAMRAVDVEKLEADLKPMLRDAERQVQVIVKHLDDAEVDVSGALQKALEHLKDVDVRVEGLEQLQNLKIEGLEQLHNLQIEPKVRILRGEEPKEIRVEVRGELEKDPRTDGVRHRVLVVPKGDGETPIRWVEKSAGGDGTPSILHLQKVDTGAEPKKKEADGGCCCGAGCCAERPKGRIMV